MSVIEDVITLTGEDQNLVAVYVKRAGDAILNRMYQFEMEDRPESVPERYESLQTQIAVYLINKIGAEGQLIHSENGIYRSYENAEVPESMLQYVTPVVKVV